MKTGTKLLASYAVLTVVLAVVGAVAYRGLMDVVAAVNQISDVDYVRSRNLGVVNEAQTDVARAAYGLFNPSTSAQRRRELLAEADAAFRRMRASWRRYEELRRTTEEERIWKELGGLWARWEIAAEAFLDLTRAREHLEAAGVVASDPRWKWAHTREQYQLLAMDAAYKATDPIIRQLDDATATLVERTGDRGEAQGRRACHPAPRRLCLRLRRRGRRRRVPGLDRQDRPPARGVGERDRGRGDSTPDPTVGWQG
jgi:hypothetical protein